MRIPRKAVIAALVFAVVYIALDFNKLYALRYGADTGSFLQFLTNEAHGRGSWNAAEMQPHLHVHDSWTLLALVPLLGLFPYAQTLLVVQVLAIAGGGVALAALARAFGASDRVAGYTAITYLISPSAQGIAYGNFLENVFVPILAILAVLAAYRKALLPALLCAQLLLGLKEDEALFLVWFGAVCAIWWDRRIGLAAAALACLNGLGFILYEHMMHAHPSVPAYAMRIDQPLWKLAFFAGLLAPFAFTPLWLGWRLLLGAPLVAELTLNGRWAYPIARTGTHWTAPVFAAAAICAAYVVSKRPAFALPMLLAAILCALTINDTVLKFGRWPFVVDWPAYARAVQLRDSKEAVTVERKDEGVYAVAASNSRVSLARWRRTGGRGLCPGYNKDGLAFLASIGIGRWPRGTTLCQGVAIRR